MRTDEWMKETYNKARPEDVSASFDREALWSQISERMPAPAPKKPVYLRWVSYAAAVAAGMLLMWFRQSGPQQEQLSANRNSRTAEIVQPLAQVSAPVAAEHIIQPQKKIKAVVSATSVVTVAVQPVPSQAVRAVEPLPNKADQPVVAVNEPEAMPVRHLMDIGNEDRRILDAGPLPELQKATFIRLNRPGGSNEGQQELALRNVFLTQTTNHFYKHNTQT